MSRYSRFVARLKSVRAVRKNVNEMPIWDILLKLNLPENDLQQRKEKAEYTGNCRHDLNQSDDP